MRSGVVAVTLGAVLALPAAAAGQDPQAFRFDGGGYDRAAAITTDAAGNSFVAGSARPKRSSSFVVVKTGPDGARRWTARYDGSRGGPREARRARWPSTAPATCTPPARSATARSSGRDCATISIVGVRPRRDAALGVPLQRPRQRHRPPSAVVLDEVDKDDVTGSSYGQGFDWATLKLGPRRGAALGAPATRRPASPTTVRADMVRSPDGNLGRAGVTQNSGDGQTNDAETVAYDPEGAIAWRSRWSGHRPTATS